MKSLPFTDVLNLILDLEGRTSKGYLITSFGFAS